MPCQQGCLQALQQEPGIVVGDVAGLFAPKPSEKSQQSMANNTLPAAAASIFSPEGLAAGRQAPGTGDTSGGTKGWTEKRLYRVKNGHQAPPPKPPKADGMTA
ncbi:hypothetical protein LEMLEM_LOCUS26985 [Lemmus lemmus]